MVWGEEIFLENLWATTEYPANSWETAEGF
jgi:hypothetical protein